MVEIIKKNKSKRILIAIDSLGKEEMLVGLAEYFQTLVKILFEFKNREMAN